MKPTLILHRKLIRRCWWNISCYGSNYTAIKSFNRCNRRSHYNIVLTSNCNGTHMMSKAFKSTIQLQYNVQLQTKGCSSSLINSQKKKKLIKETNFFRIKIGLFDLQMKKVLYSTSITTLWVAFTGLQIYSEMYNYFQGCITACSTTACLL